MIPHDSLRFDQRPQPPCSRTQRPPALVLLPHLANRAQAAFRLHRTSSLSSIAIPLSSLFFPAKTATIQAHPHRNPIDRPASTAPAAHFKRLYRNCPKQQPHPTDTSSRGSHDRVLTFSGSFYHCHICQFTKCMVPSTIPATTLLRDAGLSILSQEWIRNDTT